MHVGKEKMFDSQLVPLRAQVGMYGGRVNRCPVSCGSLLPGALWFWGTGKCFPVFGAWVRLSGDGKRCRFLSFRCRWPCASWKRRTKQELVHSSSTPKASRNPQIAAAGCPSSACVGRIRYMPTRLHRTGHDNFHIAVNLTQRCQVEPPKHLSFPPLRRRLFFRQDERKVGAASPLRPGRGAIPAPQSGAPRS